MSTEDEMLAAMAECAQAPVVSWAFRRHAGRPVLWWLEMSAESVVLCEMGPDLHARCAALLLDGAGPHPDGHADVAEEFWGEVKRLGLERPAG